MGFVDACWHLLNLVAPAFGLGALAAALAKLVFRRELQAVAWRGLASYASVGALTMLLAGLAFFGRDGKITTYAAMVLACSLMLWWRGFGPGRRG